MASSEKPDRAPDPPPRSGPAGRGGGALPAARRRARRLTLPSRRAARRLAGPPRQRDRLLSFLALLACLLLAAIPLLSRVHQPGPLPGAEVPTLEVSFETWVQSHVPARDDWSVDAIAPWREGRLLLEAAPATTWLHLASFRPLGDQAIDADQLLRQARTASVLLTLLTVAGVFWAALTIGGRIPALLAGLVCAANPLLLFEGRLATALPPSLAFCALAVAGGLWALRPMKPTNRLWPQALGWGVCGACLGIAILAGGLLNAALILLPLGVMLAMTPGRLGHALGLLAAVFLAGLITTPWALYVHERDPEIWQSWLAALGPAEWVGFGEWSGLVGRRFLILLLVTLPWTPWLLAGLIQPFSTSSTGSRLRMMLGWVWFVPTACLLLLLPTTHEQPVRLMMLAIPAGSLVVGQVMRQFVDLSAEGRHATLWSWLRWPVMVAFVALSVLMPLGVHFQEELLEGWQGQPWLIEPHPLLSTALGIGLFGLAGWAARYALDHRPGKATACWALWTVAGFIAVLVPLSQGPYMQQESAEHILQRIEASSNMTLDRNDM